MHTEPELRLMSEADSFDELTELLHRAYAELAARGLRFYATHQPVSATRDRASKGECWIALMHGRIVGTVTMMPPDRCSGSPWYDRPEVAKFGQLGVSPDLRGKGLGGRLITLAEDRARACGARELALDTAEEATHLIALYTARGYRFIEHVDWRPDTNYRSVLMSKALV